MIEVEDLTKNYGSHLGIEGLTFSAQKGETVGFLLPVRAGWLRGSAVPSGAGTSHGGGSPEVAIDWVACRSLFFPALACD